LSAAQLQPDDEAIIMFTSGTTGGSKAVLLTQRAVMTGIMNIQYSMAVIGARIQALQVAADDSFAARQSSSLLAVPLFHSSGCFSVFLSNLLRGGKVVILPKWNAERALALIEEEQIMAFSGAPTMLWDLLRQDRSGRDLNCLLSLGVGGQALQPHLLREIVAAFPRAMLGGGYGMTESSGSVCLIAGEDLIQRPTSSGHVLAAADLRLVDEQGVEVDAGAVGEICLRGAMVMRGYCKRPNDTAAVLRDGWLHTGDLGRLDAEGYLYVIDRKKDIVISGGENISCTEVEGAAMEHPALLEAAAFGVVDERLGEMLVMAIVPKADHAIDDRVLKEHVAQRLAIYKVPRAVMVCAVLPRNALGKVNRNELRERFLARISQDA
jgi:acyl-CoA synthetase (AMP-forming)/AMP-acid ligase II